MSKDEDRRDVSAALRLNLKALCDAMDRPAPRVVVGIAQPEDDGSPVVSSDSVATPLETVATLLEAVSSLREDMKKIGPTAGPLLVQRVDDLIERISERCHHPSTRIQAALDLVSATYGGEGALTVNIDPKGELQFWHTKDLSPGRGVALGVAVIAALGLFLNERGAPIGGFIFEQIKTLQAEVVKRMQTPPDDGKPD